MSTPSQAPTRAQPSATGTAARTTRNNATRHHDLGAGLDLLDRAGTTLLQACRADTTTDRYILAHLGALRAAAALLATRQRRGRRLRSVWESLADAAPELSEWADYLALCGERRGDLERGGEPAGTREADDLLRGAETFLRLVQAALGLPVTRLEPPLAVAERS